MNWNWISQPFFVDYLGRCRRPRRDLRRAPLGASRPKARELIDQILASLVRGFSNRSVYGTACGQPNQTCFLSDLQDVIQNPARIPRIGGPPHAVGPSRTRRGLTCTSRGSSASAAFPGQSSRFIRCWGSLERCWRSGAACHPRQVPRRSPGPRLTPWCRTSAQSRLSGQRASVWLVRFSWMLMKRVVRTEFSAIDGTSVQRTRDHHRSQVPPSAEQPPLLIQSQ